MDDDLRIRPIRPSMESRTKRKEGRGGNNETLEPIPDQTGKKPVPKRHGRGGTPGQAPTESDDDAAEGSIIDILA